MDTIDFNGAVHIQLGLISEEKIIVLSTIAQCDETLRPEKL